jgi:hypothetical protein
MTSSLLERPVSLDGSVTNAKTWDLRSKPWLRAISAPALSAELFVQRTDIQFRNVTPGRVRISVNVANLGLVRSQPTPMVLQAAPLGAFVPWKELTSVLVPSIEPGESVEVATEVSTPPTRPLGEFSRVPPRKLLTAIASDDEPDPRLQQQPDPKLQQPIVTSWRNLLALLFGKKSNERSQPTLPDDPMNLLARPNVHWAGNINVLIGLHAVERHLAQALRVYPGRTNLAVFFVGDRVDDYQFDFTGTGAAWEAALFDCTGLQSLVSHRAQPIQPSKWTRLDGRHLILLALSPPANCAAGSVNIHVCQRSTNRDAIVEFSLDPTAAGAGCYTV